MFRDWERFDFDGSAPLDDDNHLAGYGGGDCNLSDGELCIRCCDLMSILIYVYLLQGLF